MIKSEVKIAEAAIQYGVRSLIVFVVLFLIWAFLLPIKSASIADGIVVLDFNRRTIQHYEGGIIEQILVKDGQMVERGSVLLYLRDIKAKSEQQIIKEKLWTMQIQRQRLIAEKDSIDNIDLDKFMSAVGDVSKSDTVKIAEIIENQSRLLEAKNDKRVGEIRVLEQKLKSSEVQLKIFKEELNLIKPLVDEGNLPKLRELDLEKSISELEYEIESNRLQVANYKNDDLSEILKEIKETDLEITGLFNQLAESKDILVRSEVMAPVSGKVLNMKYHTIGAVVPPGGEIMNIVPQHEELIIEAKVKPQDIDNIAIGSKAKVVLTAYQGKKVPKLNGAVIDVSADIITNPQTSEAYFLARINIDKNDIDMLKEQIELYPGMPAQVLIITGSRSFMSYLFAPIKDSAYKAFREE